MKHVDHLALYEEMFKARAFELALEDLWLQGLVSGEMHLGTGEEGVAVGVALHLEEGDAVALDHRPTPVLSVLGVDPVLMLREMLGRADGLCRGQGGHMHLFAPEYLAASTGIVGASGPAAVGFGLAAKVLRPGHVAVAFFGDGAANQGMLLESLNLAVAWSVPVLFVCKDNGWAVTTRSSSVTGGDLVDRAVAFGLDAAHVDGRDVQAVHESAGRAIAKLREGGPPAFLRATCPRLDGHVLGDTVVRAAQHPIAKGRSVFGKVVAAALAPRGGGVRSRATSVAHMMAVLRKVRKERRESGDDPLVRARKAMAKRRDELEAIEQRVVATMGEAVEDALATPRNPAAYGQQEQP